MMDERIEEDRGKITPEMDDEQIGDNDEGSEELTIDHMREVKEFYAEIKEHKLVPAVKTYKSLRLDLADTGLKKSDVSAVIEKLKTGSGFQRAELYLLGCKLTDDLLFTLLECLLGQARNSLKEIELDLRENSLTSNSLPMLLEVLGAFEGLESFKADLSDNQLVGKQDQFAAVTYGSPKLRFLRLNLENTNTGSVVVDRFFASLSSFPSLHTLVLNLGGCQLAPITRNAVNSLVQSSLVNLDVCVSETGATVGELVESLGDVCQRFLKNLSVTISGCGEVSKAPASSSLDEEHIRGEIKEPHTSQTTSTGVSTMTSSMMLGEERTTACNSDTENLEQLLAEEQDEDLREVIRDCIRRKAETVNRSEILVTPASQQKVPAESIGNISPSKKNGSGAKLQRIINLKGTRLAGFQGTVVKNFEARHNIKVVQ